MAHNDSFTRIWAEEGNGLSLYEIRRALGVNKEDLGFLCTRGETIINKWAKYKPIRYPNVFTELTEEQRKGYAGDINNGIYYGVKLSGESRRYDLLHDITFGYVGVPRGASVSPVEPYRLLDFNGYISTAMPSVRGSMPTSFYFDLDDLTEIGCRYQLDSGGIDYAEVLGGEDKLKNAYPCVIISDEEKETHYICALKTNTGIDYEVLPMYRSGIGWTSRFWCDLSSTVISSLRGENIHLTLFLVVNPAPPQIPFPIDGEWHEYSSSIQTTVRGYAVPNGVDATGVLAEYYITANPISCVADMTGLTFKYQQTGTHLPVGTTSRKATITDTRLGTSIERDLVINISTFQGTVRVTWDELGIRPTTGMQWSYRTQVTYTYTDGKQKQGTYQTYSGTL